MRLLGTGFAAGRWGVLALAFGVAASCSESQPSAAAQRPLPAPHLAVAEVPPPADGAHGAGKRGGGNFKESTVYVDGKATGILRYSELPSALAPIPEPEIDDLTIARYYRLADYLALIGVDLA
ncbi:MAG: hypothetical protein ACRELB_25065, partial [Polyangiaceae bacterium]